MKRKFDKDTAAKIRNTISDFRFFIHLQFAHNVRQYTPDDCIQIVSKKTEGERGPVMYKGHLVRVPDYAIRIYEQMQSFISNCEIDPEKSILQANKFIYTIL